MSEYKITTTDPLTAHRVAGVLYEKLCSPPTNPQALPLGQQQVTDQVPGVYFQDGNRAGYRVRMPGYSFEVCIGAVRPKSARDHSREFTIVLEEAKDVDPNDFDRALHKIQSALGLFRRSGRA